ncbi:hypothetical protein VTN77DRAFT_3466 [Rasamsonia byssochlamydoides]|uniref:uncharacterized protein n=1 Tax=Rasamsonia byssochlamydoides TaxID=89139 RepID=UPI003742057F
MGLSKALVSALSLYSAVAVAAPTAPSHGHFSINQVAVPRTKPRAPPAAEYARALRKYKANVPSSVASAAAGSVTGSATNQPITGDEEYVTPVIAGQSTLHLDFDTGSADLWVFSSQTPRSERGNHSIYTPSASAKKLNGYTWSISYGDGSSASGDVYLDTISVGGVNASSQAVEAATQVSSEFTQDTGSDGLLGLAFSSINTVQPQRQTTFFDTVKSQLAKPLFAVTLKHNAPGSYDFGFIDPNKYNGSIAYTQVDNSQGFWQFTADDYAIGGSSGGSSINGIADTGTTLLLLDNSIVNAYYQQVQGAQNDQNAGGYVFPCNAQLPTFSITIGNYEAVVPAEFLNFQPVDQTGQTCFGGLQSNQGVGFSIFGDVFLKSQYVVFDSNGPRLGFAAQA